MPDQIQLIRDPQPIPRKKPGANQPSLTRDEQPSAISAMWNGFLQGVKSTGMGAAQLAQRTPDPLGFMPRPASVDRYRNQMQQTLDQTIRGSEQQYQADPRTQAHPIASGIGRIGGETLATAPLAMVPGGAATGAARFAGGALAGAGASALQPVTGGDFAREKVKQAGEGLAGGLAGGAIGDIFSSTLGKAIAGNTPQAIEAALSRQFRKAVPLGRNKTYSQFQAQDRQLLSAVDSIIAEKPNLTLTDARNFPIQGALPRTVGQLSDAIEQTKASLFRQYDQMAKGASGQGIMVDLTPAVNELRGIASNKGIVDMLPNVAHDAQRLADNLAARGAYTAEEAQDTIQAINRTLKPFYRNPTAETVNHSSLVAPAVAKIREELDKSISSYSGPGYQQLKNRYGDLVSIENNVAAALTKDAEKYGLKDVLWDVPASREFMKGVFTISPRTMATAVGIKALQSASRYLNSPNRAIEKLFEMRQSSVPSGPARQAIGSGIQRYLPGVGSTAGGLTVRQIGDEGPQGGTVTGQRLSQ